MNKKKRKEKIISEWGKPKAEHFNFDLIDEYSFFKNTDDSELLSDKTLVDLDFHDYFKFIDRTHSCVGQQFLFHKLKQNEGNQNALERQEELVHFYNSNSQNRLDSQMVLSDLSKSTDYYFPFLMFGELPEKMNNYWLVLALQFLLIICVLLFFKHALFFFPILIIVVINLCLHYWHKSRIGNFAAYFSRLVKLSSTLKKLIPLGNFRDEEKSQHHDSIHRIDKITSQVLFLKTDDLQENEFTTFIWFLIELVKVVTLGEILVFNKLVDQINASRVQIENLFKAIGKIDVAISICSLREGLRYHSTPNFLEQTKEMELKDLYHPLVPNCISNDIHLRNKSLLLTGSNMAGKSTFIKAINLNVITSQVLNTSFSNYYAGPIWKIETSMSIKDNLQENSSYYMEEVHSIGKLLKCSEENDKQYLFTIDEIFKGTNTIERISTAKAILEYLINSNHLVLVSTHDIELTRMLNNQFDLYYFQESITDKALSFDYLLKKGILQKSNAIKILELSNYPDEVIKEAKVLAIQLANEKTGLVKKEDNI